MVIEQDQLGSDHRPCVLTLSGLELNKPKEAGKREAWRTDRIPCPPEDWSWVDACRERFSKWTEATTSFLASVREVGADADLPTCLTGASMRP